MSVPRPRDQDVRTLTIATTGTGARDLFVSYVSEVPVWKATYRLVLPTAGETRKPLLQGWAIVDNTVGQDWENVQLSLVSGAPQSFIQQISRPYYVQRPIVPLPDASCCRHRRTQSALGTDGPGTVSGTVSDGVGIIPGATVQLTRQGARIASTTSDGWAAIASQACPAAITMSRSRCRGFDRSRAASTSPAEWRRSAELRTPGRRQGGNRQRHDGRPRGRGRGRRRHWPRRRPGRLRRRRVCRAHRPQRLSLA